MSNWIHTIDISESFQKCRDKEISIQSLCKVISEKLSKIVYTPRKDISEDLEWLNETIQDWANTFKELAESEETTIEDFDSCLGDLYDFGDTTIGNYHSFAMRSFAMASKALFIKT
jgi:hypothetical protein